MPCSLKSGNILSLDEHANQVEASPPLKQEVWVFFSVMKSNFLLCTIYCLLMSPGTDLAVTYC